MHSIVILLVNVVCLIVFSAGDQCRLLDGSWYDEHGSLLKLEEAKDGALTGHYETAEGRLDFDSESNGRVNVAGVAQYNQSGAVFSLSGMWRAGAIKVWTGQCLMSGGGEVLQTISQSRRKAANCHDKTSATSIGDERFTRRPAENDEKNAVNSQPQLADRKLRRRSVQDADSARSGPQRPCSLLGVWYNELGSVMNITSYHDTEIRGTYYSPVGDGNSGHSGILYGMGNDRDTSSTIALHVAWKSVGSATGWAGQCHLCGENQTEILSTTWMLRRHADSYQENWDKTLAGFNYFKREKQIPGPRK